MKTIPWILFVCSLLLFGWGLLLRWTYRRRGEAVPWPFAGSVAGGLGMVCLSGMIVLEDGWYVWVLAAAGLALIIVESVVFRRARKRAMGSPPS